MKCFYRRDSYDATLAAAIVLKENPDCELIPIDPRFVLRGRYQVEGEVVYVIGLRLTDKDLAWFQEACEELRWYDNSVQSARNTEVLGKRSVEMSLSRMAADDSCNRNYAVVELLDRWELRHTVDSDVEGLVGYLSLFREAGTIDPGVFAELLKDTRSVFGGSENGMTRELVALRRSEWQTIMAERAYEGVFCSRTATIVNSDIRDYRFFDGTNTEIGISYVYDGAEFIVNLFTELNSVNVSEMAEMYGGGGRPWHAEFSVSQLPHELQHRDKLAHIQRAFVGFSEEFGDLGLVVDSSLRSDERLKGMLRPLWSNDLFADACNRIAIAYRNLKDLILDGSHERG